MIGIQDIDVNNNYFLVINTHNEIVINVFQLIENYQFLM